MSKLSFTVIRCLVENMLSASGYITGKIIFMPCKVMSILFQAVISGYFCSQFSEIRHAKIRIGSRLFLRGAKYIQLNDDVTIGKNVVLTAWDHYRNQQTFHPNIYVGKGCKIGDFCNISAINSISLGENVLIGRYVTIIDHSHGRRCLNDVSKSPWDRDLYSRGGVKIGRNVWVGDKATILPDVSIGNNCIIGANSVVTKSFPDNCVIAGNPAKILGTNA